MFWAELKSSDVLLERKEAVVKASDCYKSWATCFIAAEGQWMTYEACHLRRCCSYGSGTGSDHSALRSSRKLSGGGTPPLSFMRVFDQIAAVIKSGGKTRRAKMQSLKVDHPDIMEFITCQRRKINLVKMGYDGSMNGRHTL